jgi:hypothetical protein
VRHGVVQLDGDPRALGHHRHALVLASRARGGALPLHAERP